MGQFFPFCAKNGVEKVALEVVKKGLQGFIFGVHVHGVFGIKKVLVGSEMWENGFVGC